jgi:plastocyanin
MRGLCQPLRAIAVIIVFAMMIAAPASAVPPSRAVTITIAGMSYQPAELTVRAGDTIEWINKDVVDHTATEKKSLLWNVSIAPGKRAKVVMKKVGTFDYFCRYHPNMTGRIVVTGTQTK